jgi:hypothetical protein
MSDEDLDPVDALLSDWHAMDDCPIRPKPKLEDFGLEKSDLYEVSMEVARLTDANRPFTPHSVEQSGDSLLLAALVVPILPAYLAGGILGVLVGLAVAVVVGGVVLWVLDGGYRRFAARRHPRPELEPKVLAFFQFEESLYLWRINESKLYPLSLNRETDVWVRCWWNRRSGRIPQPISYGRTKKPPVNGDWQPWDCLNGSEQNIVRFLYWRTRSSRMEFAFKLLMTITLTLALLAIFGVRFPSGD